MADAGQEVPALQRRAPVTGVEGRGEACHAVNTCRPGGWDLMPIPWTAVQHYAEAERLSEGERYLLHGVVRHLDDLLRDHAHARSQSKREARR